MRFSPLENNPEAGTRNKIIKITQRVRRSDRVDSPMDSANDAVNVKSVLPDAIWPEPAPLSSARARRDASVIQRSEMESTRIFVDFAAKIGMAEDSLRSRPTQGLTQLFRYFGPSRTNTPGTLSVHPVFLRQSDFAAWREIFGVSSAQDESPQRNESPNLQMAVQELALELLQLRHGSQASFHKMCRGVFSSSLRQGRELTAVREALANELLKIRSQDSLNAAQARWCAQLILCRHEPSLGRMDAPAALVFGSAQQLHRHLAIIDRTDAHAIHWALPEPALLQDAPPPNAPPAEVGYAALRFAYAQQRDYLLSALSNRSGVVDPAITAYAIEDLRKSLRSAGIADRLLPPGPDGLESLPTDWIERLDWVAFNGPGFLLTHGARTPYRNTLAWWLRAIDECFAPGDTFNVREMDREKRNLFVDRISDSQAFGTSPGSDWDPRFAQSLFNAFLRHYVAPLAEAPFERALCRVTEPLHFLRCGNPAVAPALPQILRSVDEVKDGLRRELFKGGNPHWPREKRQWAVQFLCSIFAPALAAGLPGQTGYGSVGYTALELALFYPGIPLGNLTMDVSRELLASGVTAELMALAVPEAEMPEAFESEPGNESGEPSKMPRMPPILTVVKRMAHAHGAIIDSGEPMTASAWEAAIAYFEGQMQAAERQGDILNTTESALAGALVNRTEIIKAVLVEMDCDPMQTFTIPSSPFAYLNLLVRTPLAFGKPHTLHEIVKEEALPQLLAYGDLNAQQRGMLLNIGDRWPKESLLRRFRADFDASLAGLIESNIVPALQRLVQALPGDLQRIFQCGDWEIRLARIEALVEKRPGAILDRRFRPTENVIAGGAVLLKLALEGETLRFMVPLRPLGLVPYTGSDAELIKKYLPVFVQPDLPGAPNAPGRRVVGFKSIKNFYTYTPRAGQGVLEAIVGHVFSEKKIEALYQLAMGETDSERSAASVRDFILGMVPGYGCGSALAPGELQGAPFICLMDAAGTVPIAGIGGEAMRRIMRIARQSVNEAASVAGLGVARRDLGRVLAAGADDAYQVALKAGRKTLGYLDPGMLDAISLWRLGKLGLTLLRNSVRNFAELHDWGSKIDRIIRMSDAVFPERGMWRAKPEKRRTDGAGNLYVRVENKRYEIAELSDMEGVLVIPDGPGRVRPVDPESGLPCGFSRRRGAMVRSSKPPGRSAAAPAGPALCRPKRSPGNMHAICTMEPAPHMGDGYYAVPASGGPPLHQALSSRPRHLLEIDPASAVYRSYTLNGGDRVPSNIFLHDSILYRRLNNGDLSIIDAGLDPDPELFGKLFFGPVGSKTGNVPDKAWYVRTEMILDRTGQGDGKVALVNMAPYSDFAGADGKPLRMVKIHGALYVSPTLGPPYHSQMVKLAKATKEQEDIYTIYEVINSFHFPPAIKNSMRRLSDEPVYRAAMEATIERFEVMLGNAKRYYELTESVSFLRKFVPEEDLNLAEQFRRQLLEKFETMQKMMPHLKKYQADFIAVANLNPGAAGDSKLNEEILAFSLNWGLAHPLVPHLVNNPLMVIDADVLASASRLELARFFGHEATHLMLGTIDGMGGSGLQFYAKLDKHTGEVDISILRLGAQARLDPLICASVLEHCLSVGDGMTLRDPRVLPVATGDSNVYGGRGEWADALSNAVSGEMAWNDAQLQDVADISHSLISRMLSTLNDGVKKKS